MTQKARAFERVGDEDAGYSFDHASVRLFFECVAKREGLFIDVDVKRGGSGYYNLQVKVRLLVGRISWPRTTTNKKIQPTNMGERQ
jgi:hypothetical protein